jgi:predicted transcriptional regulator
MRNLKITMPRIVEILKQLSLGSEMRTIEIVKNLGLRDTYYTSVMMSRLKRQGFVCVRKEKTKRFYTIANAGIEYLNQYQIQISANDNSIKNNEGV